MNTHGQAASISTSEITHFSAQAPQWWDKKGPFQALHDLMPLRLSYIEDQIKTHGLSSLEGLSVLDIGCGGGLIAEALTQKGAKVTAIDASDIAIKVAQTHAAQNNLTINYQATSTEALAQTNARFDVITALEIVEHVADLKSFMTATTNLLKPNGLLIIATVNRTKRSFLLAIACAEYILGWVPAGTHDWEKFVCPSEIVDLWDKMGLTPTDCTGVIFQPITRRFTMVKGKTSVNYFITGKKEKTASKP